jgi:hypothetical protein
VNVGQPESAATGRVRSGDFASGLGLAPALVMLAGCPDGCTEAIMIERGFPFDPLAPV